MIEWCLQLFCLHITEESEGTTREGRKYDTEYVQDEGI